MAAEDIKTEQPAAAADEVLEPEVVEAEPVEEPQEEPCEEAQPEPADELAQAKAEAAEMRDQYLRLEAEWDNFRKRTAREREEEKARATEDLVMKLLPVVDDMERSLDHAAQSNPEGAYGEFVSGVRAVYDKLIDALHRSGVEAIDPAGQPFDMNDHQAIAQVPDPTVPDNTVKDVYQKGYRMGGRVIRTAMVTVAKGGPAQPAATEE